MTDRVEPAPSDEHAKAERIGVAPATGQVKRQLGLRPLQIAYAMLANQPTSRVRVPAGGYPSPAGT
jgi:hypothetical protein